MSGPLEGLRVVDCSWGSAGPRATGLLADYGADVVWVEPPGGDPTRRLAPAAVASLDRGKRSVALDLEDPAGLRHLSDLLAQADVMVTAWRPGVAERLGLGWTELHVAHPGLVVCSISGFGTTGSHRDTPGYEGLVQAVVGTMAEQPGHRPGPTYPGLPFAEIGAAYLAEIGILAALLRRGEDGWGRHVETSLFDGALAYLSMMWGSSGDGAGGMPRLGGHRIVSRSFACADDQYLGVHTGAVGAFGRLMKAVGLDDRIPSSTDGLDMGVALTTEQIAILEDELYKIFAGRPRAEWEQLLREADVCAIEHLQPCEVFDTPQARHNGMVVTVDDPVLGLVQEVAAPAKLSLTPAVDPRPAPLLDADRGASFEHPRWATLRDGPPDARPLLAGIKILDLGAYYAGPYSSRLLADLGADVIKLEPVAGDPLRGMERPFFSAQAGKRSIAANLKDPDLARAVQGLIEWADVIHHNMRPGAAERLGLGYEQVRAVKPSIVYLYAPGWGSTGPEMMRQSFAPMLSGYVGIGLLCAGQHNPPLFPLGNEDPGNGLLGAVGALMALLHRQRSGEGQFVENPQLNATMAHMAHAVRRSDGTTVGVGWLDPLQMGRGPFERLYQTSDGWLAVVAAGEDARTALAALAGSAVDAADPDALAWDIATVLERYSTAEALAVLDGAGVPAVEPAGPNMAALLEDPAMLAEGRVSATRHPTKGEVREVGTLLRVSDCTALPHRLAPGLGEHTDEILRSVGYTADHMVELRARAAIR